MTLWLIRDIYNISLSVLLLHVYTISLSVLLLHVFVYRLALCIIWFVNNCNAIYQIMYVCMYVLLNNFTHILN